MTLDEQLKCAERELAIRKRVYPGWVARRTMTPEKAGKEIEGMEAIVATLRGLAGAAKQQMDFDKLQ